MRNPRGTCRLGRHEEDERVNEESGAWHVACLRGNADQDDIEKPYPLLRAAPGVVPPPRPHQAQDRSGTEPSGHPG